MNPIRLYSIQFSQVLYSRNILVMKNVIAFLFCIMSFQIVNAQSISLFGIDASNFPIMTGKFYAFDVDRQLQRPNIGEVTIFENSVVRTITNVTCPPSQPTKALSSVLVIDVSSSMSWGLDITTNMDLAKAAARAWVNGLPLGISECAITSFDGSNYLNQDFTNDKNRLLNAITPLQPSGGTDYDAALINPMAGGLKVSTRGKYQRVIIFLTDGQPWQDPQVAAIVAEANKQSCLIYCVTLGMSAPQSVKDIASLTGGQTFENVTTVKEAEDVYNKILQIAQGESPCDIIWKSDFVCQTAGTMVDLKWQSFKSSAGYTPPASGIISMQVTPNYIAFGKRLLTSMSDTTITLTAQNADFTVTGITRKYGSADFTVVNTTFPFLIPKNTSIGITVRFASSDSSMKYASFEIETDKCLGYFSSTGGFPGKKATISTLKLTKPNGGETFVVGSDTLITWEGIAPSDTVGLEYSVDNGRTWKLLTKKATGLKYVWKDVPKPTSTMCLVRVSQGGLKSDTSAVLTLFGHRSSVRSIAYSPNGSIIATASYDNTVRIWDANTGAFLQSLTGHTSDIRCVTFSPDGSRIATASLDSTAKIWDVNMGTLLRTLTGHKDGVWSIAFSPDGNRIATASADKTAKIWDANSGALLRTLTGHTNWVVGIAFSPDGSKIATASADNNAKIWDGSIGSLLRTLTGHMNDVWGITFSPDGSRIATASDDTTAKIWDANTGALLRTLKGHIYGLWSVAYSPNGSRIATASSDNTAKIWDANTGSLLRTLTGHTDWVHSVMFSPDGSRIATASHDNTAKIWDVDPAGFQEDISDTLFSIVSPAPSSKDINMLQCIVGIVRDSLVTTFLHNTGAYPFRVYSIAIVGPDASQFSIVSGIPPFNVLAGTSHAVEFRFRPTSIGVKNAQLVIFTQSDTLRQAIRGEGISPALEVIGTIIDFGQVDIGKLKDTLRAVTVKNKSTAPLSITTTRHAGPNEVDFTTLSGGGTFVLAQGDTAKMDLRFLPSDIGRTSGRLLFEYNGVGSPASVLLFGEGIKRGAKISAEGLVVPPFACEVDRIDTLKILNQGTDTLKINSATIGGMNPTDYQFVTPFSPSIILPDSTLLLPIKFTPASVGARSAYLELRSNSLIDSILTISLSGRKDVATFSTNTQILDIGTLCPNQTKDTVLTLTNTGTVDNTLRIQTANLILGTSAVYLRATQTKPLTVRFTGNAIEGAISEVITITDTICGAKLSIQVVGNIKLPTIVSQRVGDFGLVLVGASSILEATMVNTGTRPIVVVSPQGVTPPFTLISLTPPAGSILASNDTLKAQVRFDAVNEIQSTGHINWSFAQPCSISDSTELRGLGVRSDTARTKIVAQDITAQAGEKVHLILKLQKKSGMQIVGAPTDWYASIHYNKSILFNEQTQNVCGGTDDSCVLELSGKYNPQNDELISIPCVATLGSTDHTMITIDNFSWLNSSIVTETQTQNGKITITGTCEQGGVRLLIPSTSVTTLATRPNPVQNSLQVQYGLREPLTVTLELMNMNGQVVQTIFRDQQKTEGQYILTSDLSTIGNGVYILRLTTNRGVLTTRVDVVK